MSGPDGVGWLQELHCSLVLVGGFFFSSSFSFVLLFGLGSGVEWSGARERRDEMSKEREQEMVD